MSKDDRIALGIERDRAGGRPVARGARPARGVEVAGFEEQGVASGQDGHIFTRNALNGVFCYLAVSYHGQLVGFPSSLGQASCAQPVRMLLGVGWWAAPSTGQQISRSAQQARHALA